MSDLDAADHGPNCDCRGCGDPRSMDLLDRYLTVWILAAMAVEIGVGFTAPSVTRPIRDLRLVEVGLVLMMYPPLATAAYSRLRTVFGNWRVLGLSLV